MKVPMKKDGLSKAGVKSIPKTYLSWTEGEAFYPFLHMLKAKGAILKDTAEIGILMLIDSDPELSTLIPDELRKRLDS